MLLKCNCLPGVERLEIAMVRIDLEAIQRLGGRINCRFAVASSFLQVDEISVLNPFVFWVVFCHCCLSRYKSLFTLG
jgi:hypothetical protein